MNEINDKEGIIKRRKGMHVFLGIIMLAGVAALFMNEVTFGLVLFIIAGQLHTELRYWDLKKHLLYGDKDK